MLLYIDSLFGEARERDVKPLHTLPETLSELYLMAMREHKREGVLERREGDWVTTPDWRFDRHVIRLALYFLERADLQPGDRVAIVSALRPEWPVVDFAAVSSGAVSVGIEPSLPEDDLVRALRETAPRVVFLPDREMLDRLAPVRTELPDWETVILFDGQPEDEDEERRIELYSAALDLGGTLDTPERAQNFRGQARDIVREQEAVCHYGPAQGGRSGSGAVRTLSHGEVIDALKPFWDTEPAREGDVAYLVGPEMTLELRLALFAFVGDGYTMSLLGTPGSEIEEIDERGPDKIVAPPSVLERLARREPRSEPEPGGLGDRLRRTMERLTASGRARQEAEARRNALGGRARWIAPTAPLERHLADRLSAVAVIGLNGVTERSPRTNGSRSHGETPRRAA